MNENSDIESMDDTSRQNRRSSMVQNLTLVGVFFVLGGMIISFLLPQDESTTGGNTTTNEPLNPVAEIVVTEIARTLQAIELQPVPLTEISDNLRSISLTVSALSETNASDEVSDLQTVVYELENPDTFGTRVALAHLTQTAIATKTLVVTPTSTETVCLITPLYSSSPVRSLPYQDIESSLYISQENKYRVVAQTTGAVNTPDHWWEIELEDGQRGWVRSDLVSEDILENCLTVERKL